LGSNWETNMKICPVCNDSFADELRFCDIDGARLAREAGSQDRNRWWSLLGAGLVVGALVISAASIVFLPKARVSTPILNSQPQSVIVPSKPPVVESATNVTSPDASDQPEDSATEAVVPELKKKDKATANNNVDSTNPNPKAAALAAEDADKSVSAEPSKNVGPAKTPESVPSEKSAGDARVADPPRPPQPAPELKKERTQPVNARTPDKDSSDKKKNDDKDKKKSGGFLRVFKKIFGKG
jgi:hypothetical protein